MLKCWFKALRSSIAPSESRFASVNGCVVKQTLLNAIIDCKDRFWESDMKPDSSEWCAIHIVGNLLSIT